jgi:hypothetical protein
VKEKSMKHKLLLSTVVWLPLVLFGVAAPSVDPLTVTSTTIDYSTNQITINGSVFSTPTVTFNTIQLVLKTNNATQIVATLPVGIIPGTYKLQVKVSNRSSVEFAVAYGAGGPQGPIGETGATGPAGPTGPPGQDADLCNVYLISGKLPPVGICGVIARFVDNGNGTITDSQTGLMWETKQTCSETPPDSFFNPRCSNNQYAFDTKFTGFLDRLNGANSSNGAAGSMPDLPMFALRATATGLYRTSKS